ncbi:IDLSRF-like peptide [Macrosteles quadrilineatus]|uniref:IDLSRF-like peptide n=1 Tax=Macrosteles quadrilineatus TaxID=74068 RepID=UPI0023E308F6|nr:IDLSRF-like peptide [Macrosteles quadrilineatus]XP_054272340.1 IDLSRF-like peptide [Macrosteles quadrilineatus]
MARASLQLRLMVACVLAVACVAWPQTVMAIDLSRLYGHMSAKRNSEACHPYEPFKCPGDGACISIQYLCDGAPDCLDGYDEDSRLCTAAKRPPVEETSSFLQSLLASHGPNYLEKLFGSKARDALAPLGGVDKVAITLSESQTIEDFGAALHLMRSDLEHLRSVFMAVENGDLGMLKSLGIKDSELGDVKFFLEKLVNTGFLD